MANSVYPDETPRSAASHLGLHCLPRHVCQDTKGIYGNKKSENHLLIYMLQNIIDNTILDIYLTLGMLGKKFSR